MPAGDGAGIVAAGRQAEQARGVALDALDRTAQHDRAAVGLDVALQRQHVAVAVDDAGGGRQQGRNAGDLRLQRAGRVGAERLQVGDAVPGRRLSDGGELGQLALAVATSSLPQRACATVFSAQKA